MFKTVTFSEFQDNLDQMLDQIEADETLEFQIINDRKEPVAKMVSVAAMQKEDRAKQLLVEKLERFKARSKEMVRIQGALNNSEFSFRLSQLLMLEPGWLDGEGSEISLKATETVLAFAERQLELDTDDLDLSATVSGGIIIDYLELGNKRRWMMEIEKDGSFNVVSIEGDKDNCQDTISMKEAIESYQLFILPF